MAHQALGIQRPWRVNQQPLPVAALQHRLRRRVPQHAVPPSPYVLHPACRPSLLLSLQYTIDSTLAVEQSRRAIVAMIVSAVVTCAFLLLRFGPGFSAAGFISLASAGLFAICCFAMGGYEVSAGGVRWGCRACFAKSACSAPLPCMATIPALSPAAPHTPPRAPCAVFRSTCPSSLPS